MKGLMNLTCLKFPIGSVVLLGRGTDGRVTGLGSRQWSRPRCGRGLYNLRDADADGPADSGTDGRTRAETARSFRRRGARPNAVWAQSVVSPRSETSLLSVGCWEQNMEGGRSDPLDEKYVQNSPGYSATRGGARWCIQIENDMVLKLVKLHYQCW